MGEQRFEADFASPSHDEMRVWDRDKILTAEEARDLLNQQAETIEVLREWIRSTKQGQEMILQAQFWAARESRPAGGTWEDPVRREFERRIAALEGT